MKKTLFTAVVLVAILVGWLLSRNKGVLPIVTPTSTPSISSSPSPSVSGSPILLPSITMSPSPVVSKNTVIYTDSGYSPSKITIKKGETVTWKNQSSGGMWTASDPHPIHNGYPISGGCVGSIFDACRTISSGAEWSFTFTLFGTWGYHNHRNPAHTGNVIVQ